MKTCVIICLSLFLASCSFLDRVKPVQVKTIAERPPMYHPPLPSEISIQNSKINLNETKFGGGIYISNSNSDISNTLIENNYSDSTSFCGGKYTNPLSSLELIFNSDALRLGTILSMINLVQFIASLC